MEEEFKQATVFFTLIIGALLMLGVFWFFDMLNMLVVLIVILVILIVLQRNMSNFFAEIEQYEKAVVFRMGKFRKVAEPGWLFVIPFIESFQIIDLREQMIDLMEQPIVTEDNIELHFDVVIYMKVKDPKKAVLEVKDFKSASKQRAKARLRGIAGNMKMTEIVSNVDEMNDKLQEYMDKVEGEWGITFPNVEIQSVDIPDEIQDAVQSRRAATEVKEQKKQEAIGDRMQIDEVRKAADKLGDSALQYYYLEALKKVSEGKSSKIIFPLELSKLAGGLSDKIKGVEYKEAQDKVVDKYEEMRKKGKDKESIVKELKKEMEEGELEEEIKEED